jgi:membrane protease YdiL (CAAX protease family)
MGNTRFIQMALEGRNEWWRYLSTLFLVFLGWQFIGVIPLFVFSYMKADNVQVWIEAAESAFVGLGINSNLYLLLIIFSFIGGLVFLLLGVRTVHHRSVKSLVSSRKIVDWNRIVFGFTFWLLVSILMITLDYLSHPEDFINNFKLVPFVILVLVSLVFIPFQTSFEELLFRGYLMQGIGLLFRNAWAPLILTSVGFGLLHAFNPEVEKLGSLILLYYIGTGFLFGIITLMDQGTELALGMHAANNIVAATIVTVDWAVFQTDALLVDQSEPSLGVEMLLPLLIVYPLAIVFLSRKYQWKDWKQRLAGKIDEIKE